MARLTDLLTELQADFEAAELVYGHGTDNAWDEAVALALGVLEWRDDRSNLEREIADPDVARIRALAQRRIDERVPVPLLLGTGWFAGLRFEVAPGVMVPRSPIAELITQRFAPWLIESPTTVLDLCCGGGCIGIACAYALPEAQVVLADVAAAATQLAQRNVSLHQLADRVQVLQGDLYEPLAQRFDLIVCNPPYVPSAATAARPAEFHHEPDLAYEGGDDGMQLVDRIIRGAPRHLTSAGLLVLEVGQFQREFEARYPDLPYIECELRYGGVGVLLLEAASLAEHTAQRAG